MHPSRRPLLLGTLGLLALGGVVAVTPAHAQWASPSRNDPRRPAEQAAARANGVIDGVVTDSALKPVPFAEVVVFRTDIRLQTNALGRFRFDDVPPGQYLLVVRRLGFRPISSIIDVPARDTVRLNFSMEPAVRTLETVTVVEESRSARMLEFEARRKQGFGTFLTEEQIEKRNLPVAADYLRLMPTISLAPSPNASGIPTLVAISKREGGSVLNDGAGACAMQIVIDGIPMSRNFPLELLPTPKEIAGIEVYDGAATVPQQFGGVDRRCGMVLVWTKDR